MITKELSLLPKPSVVIRMGLWILGKRLSLLSPRERLEALRSLDQELDAAVVPRGRISSGSGYGNERDSHFCYLDCIEAAPPHEYF